MSIMLRTATCWKASSTDLTPLYTLMICRMLHRERCAIIKQFLFLSAADAKGWCCLCEQRGGAGQKRCQTEAQGFIHLCKYKKKTPSVLLCNLDLCWCEIITNLCGRTERRKEGVLGLTFFRGNENTAERAERTCQGSTWTKKGRKIVSSLVLMEFPVGYHRFT